MGALVVWFCVVPDLGGVCGCGVGPVVPALVPPPRSSLRDGQATSKVNINIRASPASQQSIKKKNSPVVVKTEKGAAPQFDVRPENFNEMVFWFAERTFNRRSMAATTTPSSLTFMLLYMAPP